MISKCILVAGVVGLTAAVANADVTQWSGNNHWYEPVLTPVGITWSAASAAATAKGGYLATLTSAQENTFVFGLISGNSDFWRPASGANTSGPWLGGSQSNDSAGPAGNWSWVTGEAWSYTNWSVGEPNNFYTGENYLHYLGAGGPPSAVWNDTEIGGHAATGAIPSGYIIEYNTQPVPEPSSLGILAAGGAALLIRKRANR
jgi:hypothetical protein